MIYFIIIAAFILVLFLKGVYDKKKLKTDTLAYLKRVWGDVPNEIYSEDKRESLQFYYKKHKSSVNNVDNITWNDLDMNQVFMTVNATCSAIGEEYLYYILRTPLIDESLLNEREKLIEHFRKDEQRRIDIQMLLSYMGKMKNISIYEYMNRLNDVKPQSNENHILQAVLLLGSIALIFFNPVYGIIGTVVMFIINTITYFKRKSEIEKYFDVVSYIIRWIDMAKDISKLDDKVIKDYTDKLGEIASTFKSFRSGATVVAPKTGNGDILQSFLDYIRMAFHFDLMKFNRMLAVFRNKAKEFNEMYEIIGKLDSMIAVASYRDLMEDWVCPKLCRTGKPYIKAAQMYHPMLNEPVKNDVNAERSSLITGSNASGKSTFIKTLAINAILAQTINTVMADKYESSYFKIVSSMALQDSIESGESYYIVEIKSLKRIIDGIDDEIPTLCFVDEVLRGTNTLERVAASSQILSSLSKSNALCFAATHDIELTYILENMYDNYHFKEHIEGNAVLFDYHLNQGRAVSRNAIKLLGMLGYDENIINTATDIANNYIATGEWSVL